MNDYQDLIKAIADNKLSLARSIIIGFANQSVSKVIDAMESIKSNAQSIFEPHEESLYPINSDESMWNENYWHGLTSDMMHNFSEIRFNHLLDVAKALNPKPEKIKSNEVTLSVAIRANLDKHILEGNLSRIRSEIVGLANVNIQDALKAFIYTVDKKPDVLQIHDENLYPIDRNEKSWNSDYWNGITSDLMHNFSKERFEHAFQVAAYLSSKEERSGKNDQSHLDNTGYSRQKEQNEYHSERNEQTKHNKSDESYSEEPSLNAGLKYILIAVGIVIAIPLALWIILKN